ncbi:GFA family protein [Kordiimonas marina]|uniref:GFA family protein n=1 Tax=Kordiimonas marina TaxID=2872312 RepID=UPI001FF67246|nr:GFA family protein [Kordiimonas marina]MCJ9429385.1 GFA family protein [Kordiimonas marina]
MTEDGILYTGRCLCGGVKMEAVAEPLWVAHCHCPSCRKTTGAAFATYVGFDKNAVRFIGELQLYKSSPGVMRRFCPTCGGTVSFMGEAWPGEVHLHAGFLDQAESLKPESHVFTRTEMPWAHMDDGLERHETFPSDDGH